MEAADLSVDINEVARFLAAEQIKDITRTPVDCIVICVSSVFTQAERVFAALEDTPSLTQTLVLVGGIGHSTQPLYDAVARNPKYRELFGRINGQPESRVLEQILRSNYDLEKITSNGCKVLIEDKSTNCGSNAIETRKVLEAAGVPMPQTFAIVQDPTMLLRTVASFQKAYEDIDRPPSFLGCPIFVPRTQIINGELEYDLPEVPSAQLWEKARFFELLVGEIPRLKDDENGYGPRGKRFIVHVDITSDIHTAWLRLLDTLQVSR